MRCPTPAPSAPPTSSKAGKKLNGKGKSVSGATTVINRVLDPDLTKEQQAHLAKEELLVLWTDYFKPPHLEAYPDLHTTFWNAAKLCSDVKTHVSLEKAEALLAAIEEIHGIFWATKSREIDWDTAG